jgi:hypothetical protein
LEDADGAPVNHLALVKTSDQPSLNSSNFLPFVFAEAVRASVISPVSSLKLQPNTYGGTANKIMSSPYRKFVGATQKKKIKQATKTETNWLASNALLGPSKRRKRWVCWNPTSSDTPSDLGTDLAVPFNDNSVEEEEQDTGTGHLSEDHNREEWIQCAKYLRLAHTLCAGMKEDFVSAPCQG